MTTVTHVLHHLTLRDRGAVHRHRWAPECRCGWVSRFWRRKQEAVGQYRTHCESINHVAHERAAKHLIGPQALTPVGDLPEELR